MPRGTFGESHYDDFKRVTKEFNLDQCIYQEDIGFFVVVTFKHDEVLRLAYAGTVIPPTFNEDFPKAQKCDTVSPD